jgi:hypothetical protein
MVAPQAVPQCIYGERMLWVHFGGSVRKSQVFNVFSRFLSLMRRCSCAIFLYELGNLELAQGEREESSSAKYTAERRNNDSASESGISYRVAAASSDAQLYYLTTSFGCAFRS